jgi:Domain of unknown function (DUF4160)
MPRIKGIPGPYRFFFYSFDCGEREHIHAGREKMTCKFWLKPAMEYEDNEGFSERELSEIRRVIESNLRAILRAWYEHCK